MAVAQMSRGGGRSGDRSKSEAVNIVIRATNEGRRVFDDARGAILETGKAADLLRNQFVGIGVAAVSSTGAIVSKLAEVNQIALSIRGVLNSEIGQTVLTQIQEESQRAVVQTARLSEVFASLGKAGAPLLEGFLGGDRPDAVAQKSQALAESISKTLVGGIRGGIQGQFDSIFGFLPDAIRSKIDIGEALSQALGFGLDNFIENKLPSGLNAVSGGAAGGIAKSFLVPQELQALLQGNTFDALEKVIAAKVQGGLMDAYQNFDAITLGAGGDLQKAGSLVADYVTQGLKPSDLLAESLSSSLDGLQSQLGAPFAEVFQELRPRLEQGLIDAVQGLDEPLTRQVGQLVQNAVSGKGGAVFTSVRERFLAEISGLDQASGGLLSTVGSRLGVRLGASFSSGFLGRVTTGVSAALDSVDERVRRTLDLVSSVPEVIGTPLGGAAGIFGKIAGFDEPLAIFGGIQKGVLSAAEGIFEATQQLAFFQAGVGALQQFVVGGPFDLLIGQNVRLQEQLLATQSSLVATNQILDRTGQRILDPTQAIESLGPAVSSAIDYIRKGSLELVGVTSRDLVDSFQIIAGQVGQLGISLRNAADLTLSMAASLGTLGIPLFQARQEITSLLQGTIDMNSVLAKSLGITNQQVAVWKTQGRVFEELTKRLESFRAGNALAARTIGGITSNIQEIIDEIGRQVGAPLLDPVVDRLEGFYNYLQSNKEELAASLSELVGLIFSASEKALDSIIALYQSVEGALSQVPEYLIKSLANVIAAFANAIQTMIPLIEPAVNVLAALAESANALAGPFLQIAVQAFVLQKAVATLGGAFGVLGQTLPGTGELLFFLTGRGNSLINTFATLTKQIGFGAAGFLLLGQNAASIPFIASELTKRFGVFGGILNAILPQAAGFGLTMVGLAKNSDALRLVMTSLVKQSPGLVSAIAGMAAQSNFAGGAFRALAPEIQKVAQTVSLYAGNIDNATFFNKLFADSAKAAGIAARGAAMSFGLITAGAFAALFVFDKFILNNEGLMVTLKALWTTLQNIAKGIYEFLTNPVVAATGVVVGLGVAINAGLLPAIINLTKAFTGKALAAIAAWSGTATKGIAAFSEAIRGVSFQLPGLSENVFAKAKNEAAQLRSLLAEQAQAYDAAIGERKAQIASLDEQIASSSGVDELKAQRSEVRQQIAAIEAEQKAQQGRAGLAGGAFGPGQTKVYEDAIAERQAAIAKLDSQISSAPIVDIEGLRQQRAEMSKELDSIALEREQKQGQLNKRLAELEANATPPIERARAQARQVQQALEEQSLMFNEAIAQSLKLPKEQAAAQVSEILQARQDLVDRLAALNQQIEVAAATPSAGQRFQGLGEKVKNFGEVASASLTQFKGVAQRLSGDTLVRLGQAVGELGFENLAIQSAEAGNALFEAGRATLESEKAQRGFLGAIDASSASIEGFKGRLAGAATAMRAGVVSAINTVKGALASLWATAGPALLLVGAIAAVTEAVGIFSRQQESATKATKGFADAISEASLKAAQYDVILRDTAKAGKGYADERLKQLKEEASWLSRLGDLGMKNGPFQQLESGNRLKAETEGISNLIKDAAEFRNRIRGNYALIIKDEQELANLQNRLSEARAKKDDQEIGRIESRIDILKQARSARIDEINAAIAYLEKQKPLNDEQQKDLAKQIELLRTLKRTIEEIPNTKIIPAELPRLGSVFEQLSTQVSRARQELMRGVGTPDQAKQNMDILLEGTDQLMKMGAISREQARENLRILATNATAEREVQQKAQEAIAASYAEGTESRVNEFQRQTQQVEQLAADEEVGAAQREQRITEIKRQELQQRLEDARNTAAEELEIARDQLRVQLEAIETGLREARSAASNTSLSETDRQAATDREKLLLTDRESAITAHNSVVERLRRNSAQAEQSIQTEIAQNEAESRRQMRDEMLRDYDEAQTQLEGAKARGLVDERGFADRSIEITRQRLDLEEQLVEEQRSRLTEGDTQGEQALDTKLAEIQKRRVEAEQRYQEQRMAIAERARQKLLDAATEAQTRAEIEIQRLVNQGVIRRDEAEIRKLGATDTRIREELRLEAEKLKQLEAMPQSTDPEAEEKRQQQIRQSRIRTGQLTLQIAENEYRRQEAIRQRQAKLLDDEVLKRENLGRATSLSLEEEQRRLDRVNKTYELQGRILSARQGFLEASAGLIDAQMKALSDTATSERQRKEIAFITANIQLRTLRERQESELEITRLNQEQQRIALEREKIENRIARIQNAANQMKALAEAAKVQADPEATDPQKQAANLAVIAAMFEGQALAQSGAELQRQGAVQERIFRSEEGALRMRQQGDLLNAQMGVMSADPNQGRARTGRRAMRENLLRQLGLGNASGLQQASRGAAEDFYSGMFPGRFQGTGVAAFGPALPSPSSGPPIALPGLPNMRGNPAAGLEQFARSAPELASALRGIQQSLGSLMGLDFNQEIQINQNFSGEDVQNGNFRRKVRAEVIEQQYEMAQKLQQRQRAIAATGR